MWKTSDFDPRSAGKMAVSWKHMWVLRLDDKTAHHPLLRDKKKKIVNISKKKAERSPRESRQHFTRWFTCSGASACLNKRALKSSAKTREEEMAAIASVSLLCPSANMGSLTVARHKNNLLRCVLLLEGLAGRVNRPRWALLADGYRPGGPVALSGARFRAVHVWDLVDVASRSLFVSFFLPSSAN